MGCSSGKHEHELQERYGSRIHGDFDGDTVPLSPKSMNRSENEQYYSEEYHHEQPWDKSFSHPFSPSHLPTDNSMTRSEMMDRTPANVDPYRADIDGLRGLAVLAVVVYHLNSSWFPTGLVGVDIFFTISGFVVTSSLWGHFEEDTTLCTFCSDFFARRAKRLLPTALLVIVSTALALALVAPQWDPRAERFLLVGLSGAFANANNWLVYERDDYMDFFSNDVHDYNPFLHLWSLGVEEQFYLVAPWLLYGSLKAMQRGDGANTWVFLILSVVSIMFGWWIDQVLGLPYYAFYLLPARFWELAAGVILYLGCAGKEGIISDTLKRQALVLTLLQSWTALLFLVSFLVKFEEKNFPLPGALMPVFGTVCFILCGYAPFAFLNQILRFGPIVYIGKISYCIYLWHVPVLALCRWLTLGSEMPMSLRLLSLIPTTLLSMATYHFVEGPIRVEMKAMCTLISSFVASIGVGLFVVLILACRHSAGKSCFVWLAWVALTLLVVLFIVFSCQTDERGGTRNLLIFTCILVFAAFCLTYNYHINVGLHSAQHVMVNPRADERDEKPAMAQSSCTVCGCVNETWTYHLPPESCTENAWNCDRPPAPCFEGTPLGPEDFQPHVPWGHENCMGVQLLEDEILSRCLTPERIRTIWVVGDSHSFALVPCITTTAEAVGMPVHNYSWPAHHACDMDWSKLLNVLEARVNPGDIVAFAGCFFCMRWCLSHFEELIQRLVAFVQKRSAKLLVFKDVPILKYNSLNCAKSDPGEVTGCSISKEQATAYVKDTNDMLSAYSADFGMIDLFTPMFMQGRSDIFVPGTSAVAWVDNTHINKNGCRYLAPFICSGMRSLAEPYVSDRLLLACLETMSPSWVEGYQDLKRKGSDSPGPGSYRSRSRTLCRDPSSENLFVDLGAQPRCPQSGRYLENLIYHGTQLDTINEAVGLAQVAGRGSMFSSVFTLVASAMGAGCLSLPHMFSKAGLPMGLLLLTCGAVLAHISLVILMSCARYTQSRSFAELVSQLQEENLDHLDGPARDLSVDVVITLYGMAAVLIYMMLIGDFMSDIARSPLFHLEVSRHWVIMASLLVVFPLSIPRNVTALRYISFLSISAIVFLTIVVLAKTPAHWTDTDTVAGAVVALGTVESEDEVTCSLWIVLQSFAMAIFSFNAHTNAVPVALSLDQPRATRIWYVSLMSVLIELVIYATIATSGYLSFGSETQQDFIRNYPAEDRWMLVVRCVYSVPIIFGVPMNLAPAAASMQALAGTIKSKLTRNFRRQRSDPESKQSTGLRVCIVSFVLIFCAAVSIYCDAFADVIGLFGACFGTLICIIWPLRIYLKVMKTLQSKALSTMISVVLYSAAFLGMAAFVEQFCRVVTSKAEA
eukprot:symbB.v1.2.016836.t2/scaffold1278.1/size127201/5